MGHYQPWTKAECDLLVRLWPYVTAKTLGVMLGRSPEATYQKALHLGLKKYSKPLAGNKRRRKLAKYTFCMAGVHYRDVLPPEAWPMVQHFMGSLHYYAQQAEDAGVKPDVAAFMAEYGGHKRGRSL